MARIYSLKAGSKIPDAIVELASRDAITTAMVQAIGGVKRLKLGYYNRRAKEYEVHDYDEFMEVTSLLGNITLKDGVHFLHAHGNFGRRDMSVLGGHIVEAEIFPLMEVVLTPTTNRALRKFNDKLGLSVISRVD